MHYLISTSRGTALGSKTFKKPSLYVAGRIGSILRTIGIPEVEWGRAYLAAASSSFRASPLRTEDSKKVLSCSKPFVFIGLFLLVKLY